jgi:Thoeris protein ThsB, TIR-like domain
VARKVFDSFHYDRDSWRVQQVKNMGVVEGQPLLSSNDWEAVKKQGDAAIKAWIEEQMKGKSCVVVLIGYETAGRKWVNYELTKGWGDGKGLVGVHIHNLKDESSRQDPKGANPFSGFTLCDGAKRLADVAKTYDPPYSDSNSVYGHIKANLASWVEEAITIRTGFRC